MKYRKSALLLRWIALLFAILLAVLRVAVLKTAFDENGLLPIGSKVLPLTVLACAVCFGILWFLSSRLNGFPGRENFFSVQGVWLPMKLLSAGLLLAGSVLALRELKEFAFNGDTVIPCAGILSALLLGWTSLRERRGRAFFWVRLIPLLFTGAALVLRFRAWSHDPLVIHIVPALLAWTCCMMEMMLLTGFSLNVGHRRSGILFGLGAGMYACMTVPDYFLTERMALSDLLALLGVALWCVIAALELMRERTQSN
jgi:hypothetical protein